jgi:putative aminopeptidase FrvX
MRSADNLSVTGIAIRLLDYLSSNQIDATVEVIFTKLEEIKQISASIIARKNKTPFGRFDDNTHIFCLEAATVGTNDIVRHIAERDITYTDGPVIRIADNDLIYRHKTHDNQAEWLALHAIADQIDAYQHAPLLNNCDATSYTLFSQCPNILGITIPCQHKHNIADDGTITHEVIQAKDLQLTFDLLLQIVTYADTTIQPHPKAIISTTSYATPEDTLASKRKDWMRTSVAAVPRLQMSKLYPNTPYDKLRIGIASISARLRYRFNLI